MHYMHLRIKLADAARAGDSSAVQQAVKNETVFGARIMNTNMIHARPLIGKEFYRRFRKYGKYLKGVPEWAGGDRNAIRAYWGKGYRVPRDDVPTHEEVEEFWAEDKTALGI